MSDKQESELERLRLYNIFMQAPASIAILRGPDFIFEFANSNYMRLVGTDRDIIGKRVVDALPEAIGQGYIEILEKVYTTGKPFIGKEARFLLDTSFDVDREEVFLNFVYQPVVDGDGAVTAIFVHATDVTEQVHARMKIEESEHKFRNLVLDVPSATALFKGPEFVLEIANDAMLEIWAKDSSVIGKTLLEYLPEMKFQKFPALLRQVLETGETYSQKDALVLLDRKGVLEEVYMDYTYKALRDLEGYPYGILVVAQDVTDRITNKYLLEQSNEQLRQLANAMPQVVWMADPDGSVTYYNDRVSELDGARKREDGSWSWQDMTHPDDRQYTEESFARSIATGLVYEVEHRIRMKDGSYQWHLSRGVAQRDEQGKIIKWYGTATNIHEQVIADERFRTLAETLPQLIWMTDAKGNPEYFSNRWHTYSGIQHLEELNWKEFVHPGDYNRMINAWNKAMDSGQVYFCEVRLKNANGEYRWHLVHGVPLKTSDGSITNWIGSFADIQEQKNQSGKLEQLVNERTIELQRSNEELEQFAHIASHDLKEPVRKIKIFLGRLREEMNLEGDGRAKIYLEKIDKSVNRMYAMVDGVLQYSSVNNIQQTQEPVDLNLVLKNIATDLELLIEQKEASLVSGLLPRIMGYPLLINQLFYNLVYNSIKFSKKGVRPLIEVSAKAVMKDGYPMQEITVKDNGIGFSNEHIENIFKAFTRLNSKDSYEGTGLGLALCKKIVDRHGGYILAEGKENEGAVFRIGLPG